MRARGLFPCADSSPTYGRWMDSEVYHHSTGAQEACQALHVSFEDGLYTCRRNSRFAGVLRSSSMLQTPHWQTHFSMGKGRIYFVFRGGWLCATDMTLESGESLESEITYSPTKAQDNSAITKAFSVISPLRKTSSKRSTS